MSLETWCTGWLTDIFSILILNENWMDEWHRPYGLLDLCKVNLSVIFPYNTILHCANSSLTKKIMVKAIDCIWNQGFVAVCSWL